MIQTASVRLEKSDKLKDYAVTKLMAKDEFDRPTSEEALKWLWENYKDVLEDYLLKIFSRFDLLVFFYKINDRIIWHNCNKLLHYKLYFYMYYLIILI